MNMSSFVCRSGVPSAGTKSRLAELKNKKAHSGGQQEGYASVPLAPEPDSEDLQNQAHYIQMVADIRKMRTNVESIQALDDKGRMAADDKTIKEIMGKVDDLINDSSNRFAFLPYCDECEFL